MAMTHEFVRSLFAKLSGDNPSEFFESVSEDVNWTVLGTHPLAGEYCSKASFRKATFERLARHFQESLKLFTRSILVDGETAVVELFTRATTNHRRYEAHSGADAIASGAKASGIMSHGLLRAGGFERAGIATYFVPGSFRRVISK